MSKFGSSNGESWYVDFASGNGVDMPHSVIDAVLVDSTPAVSVCRGPAPRSSTSQLDPDPVQLKRAQAERVSDALCLIDETEPPTLIHPTLHPGPVPRANKNLTRALNFQVSPNNH